MPRSFRELTMTDVAAHNARVGAQDVPRSTIDVKRRLKYGNQPCLWEGQRFDSKLELERWLELRMRERAGEIKDLTRQVPFKLHVYANDEQSFLGLYVADFSFFQDGIQYVQDAKGYQSALFGWKKRHFEKEHRLRLDLV